MSTIAAAEQGRWTMGLTLASLWQGVAGRAITDELLEWPPDVIALTEVILERSQAYRFLFAPPGGAEWPPSRFASWSDAVQQAGQQWSGWVEDRRAPVPELLVEEWDVLCDGAAVPFENLAEGRDWRMCEALLTLHAIADEACAGLGSSL